MRVSYSNYNQNLVSRLEKLNYEQVKLQRQLSSGQRVTEAYEDPTAVGRSLNNFTEKARLQTQNNNLVRAESIGQFSSDSLEQLKILVDEAHIDANQSDGLSDSGDYTARMIKANQQLEQSVRVLNAKMSGDYLFAGANTGEKPFVVNRYEIGDSLLDGSGVPVRDFKAWVDPSDVDVSDVTFINAAGNVVDQATGVETTSPPTAYAGATTHAIEWAGDSVGVLKEWSGGAIINAVDGSVPPVPYGEVSLAENNGTPQLAQVSQSVVPDDLVGMISHVEYTGSTSPTDDVRFRVGEGSTLGAFSKASSNLDYLAYLEDLVELRNANQFERSEDTTPDISFATKASAISALAPNFEVHQENVLIGIVEFGALQQGIDITKRINESRFNELEYQNSKDLDIDITETIMQLNQSQVVYEAALKSGSNVMQMSLLDYI
jgi:flagellin-like hook-associated protein FlgL